MEITTDEITWSSEDISVFRSFLATETGRKLIPKLLESVPSLLKGGPTNEILIRSGEVSAWRDAALALLGLASPPPKQPDQLMHSNQYPDPTDDAQWDDGKKTT